MLDKYRQAMAEAMRIVLSRNNRNKAVGLEEMFPHGTQDLAFMLYMKSSRILGEEMSGDLVKVRDEALDIINYAGFLVAMIDKMKDDSSEIRGFWEDEMAGRQISIDDLGEVANVV